MFTKEEVKQFKKEYDFKIIHFAHYYAYTDGQT